MPIAGNKGYALKCGACGHEDVVFFSMPLGRFAELTFRMRGSKKCPVCGGVMIVDRTKKIVF
jgi:ribosomal protein S27E